MLLIEEGKIFPLTKVKPGSMIDLGEDGFSIFIGMEKIEKEEILAFKTGKICLSVSHLSNILFFVLKVGTIISDIPFHTGLIWPIVAADTVIKRNDEGRYPLHLFLVDVNGNILKAIRLVLLSEEFSEKLEMLMEKQKEESFNLDEYIEKLEEIYKELAPIDIEEMSIITFEE